MKTHTHLKELGQRAKAATCDMAKASNAQKDKALQALVVHLRKKEGEILKANRLDYARAKENGLSEAFLDRLSLENRIEGMIHDINEVIKLPDPVGEVFEERTLPNGLNLKRYRTPLGVLGVIYESRPNVTLDISALSIKSGNCSILRGGSETLHTNHVLVKIIQDSLAEADLPKDAILYVANGDRSEVKELLQLHDYIDLIIPRGSATLQQFCLENSKIPVITGGVGVCHLFVDESADVEKSLAVILNAKTQRPTVCNALDTLLVHKAIANQFVPEVMERLGRAGVTFCLDPKAWQFCHGQGCRIAQESDWSTEWMSLVLGIKVVEDLKEAIEHIQKYGTGHSDGILTENEAHADIFVRQIDSAAVYVNASTRFTDGGQFGLGAEVAISTQKIHARGPMGLKELTSYKWIVHGHYQVRT